MEQLRRLLRPIDPVTVETAEVLGHFGERLQTARRRYREFVGRR
jgi:hypothetical protein